MNQSTQALEHASVRQYCKALRMPVIGANFVRLSEQAIKEQRSHIGYLEALLAMEAEERDLHAIQKRIRDARPKSRYTASICSMTRSIARTFWLMPTNWRGPLGFVMSFNPASYPTELLISYRVQPVATRVGPSPTGDLRR
jgi:hypothetical protein